MVFSSSVFFMAFLPITLLLYFLIPERFLKVRNLWLLIASLIFYGWGEPKYIAVMAFSILFNYVMGRIVAKSRPLLILCIAGNLAILGFFKYTDFVIETVELAGANPCPPMVVGVGIGGDFEECALLAKTALCRSSDLRNPDPLYAQMEEELLRRANETNVGPQGFGGSTTALCVNIETYGTHIAGLPVAVNIGCHVTRHSSFEL